MLSTLDRNIIGLISQDIPLVKEPFKNLALQLGIKERLFFARIKLYKKKGLLRKFCASLNHKKIGFAHNAMVVWNIQNSLVTKAGNIMATFAAVSHCYQRKKNTDWNYNLYSMVHAKTKRGCLDVIREISKKINCKDYRILFSCEEYKKSAPKYFNPKIALEHTLRRKGLHKNMQVKFWV